MNGFGVVVTVFIGIVILLMVTRLARGIVGTRRMSGEGHWPADGADAQETSGTEQHDHHRGGTHHVAGQHNAAAHHNMGGHHAGGGHAGGGHMGGGHAGGGHDGGGFAGGGHHG